MLATLLLAGIVAAPLGTAALFLPARRRTAARRHSRGPGSWPAVRRLVLAVAGTSVLAAVVAAVLYLLAVSEHHLAAAVAGLVIASLVWLPATRRSAYLAGAIQWYGDLLGLIFLLFLLAGAANLASGGGELFRKLTPFLVGMVPVLVGLGLVRAVALLRRGTGASWRDAIGAASQLGRVSAGPARAGRHSRGPFEGVAAERAAAGGPAGLPDARPGGGTVQQPGRAAGRAAAVAARAAANRISA